MSEVAFLSGYLCLGEITPIHSLQRTSRIKSKSERRSVELAAESELLIERSLPSSGDNLALKALS